MTISIYDGDTWFSPFGGYMKCILIPEEEFTARLAIKDFDEVDKLIRDMALAGF